MPPESPSRIAVLDEVEGGAAHFHRVRKAARGLTREGYGAAVVKSGYDARPLLSTTQRL